MATQQELPFDSPFVAGENPQLWTPRDIWVRINQDMMSHFAEDRRLDYKRGERVDFDDMATYLSAFSNTPDGGLLIFGADSKGRSTGCSKMAQKHLNDLESCHTKMCPLARPEFKRFPVNIDGVTDFCIAVYIPYRLIKPMIADLV